MFRHLFKLIWNKKKQNFLLLTEMLASFLVIFAVFSLMAYYYLNYRKPMGFEYENVWVINYNNALQTNNADSLSRFYEGVRQMLRSMPPVREVSYTSQNVPFSNTTNGGGYSYNRVKYDRVNMFTVEDSYKNVLNLQLLEGRWFEKMDIASRDRPVVINGSFKEKLFGKGKAVGKLLHDYQGKNPSRIIGVVQDVKMKGDYSDIGYATFVRADTGSFHWLGQILVKVSPDADAAFESRLYKAMAGAMRNSNVEIVHLTDLRRARNQTYIIPLIVILIVSGFLIVNVALGLFGVLWYNINKRKAEIGLRRAVGATGGSVSGQLVAEAMILATLSLLIGTFFAIQFPLLNVGDLPSAVYLIALVLSILFIYLLVLICSLYPGRQAAAIYPAVALHEE